MASVKNRVAGLIMAGVVTATVGTNIPNSYDEPQAQDGEIVALRTENSYTTDLGSGMRRAMLSTAPIHFRKDGQWKRPDLRVKGRPWLTGLFSKYEAEVTAGPWNAKIDEEAGSYRIEAGDDWLEFDMAADSVDVDLETEITGIKETITLTADSPDTLRWSVNASTALSWDGVALTAGTIRTAPLTAWDANGKTMPIQAAYGNGTLTAVVNTTGATWPVTVDPSTTVNADQNGTGHTRADNATYLTARNSATGTPVTTNLFVGRQTGYYIYRSHLQFDLSGIPKSTALTCSLCLYGINNSSDTDFDYQLLSAILPAGGLNSPWHNDFIGWQSSGSYDAYTKPLASALNTTAYKFNDWNKMVFTAAGLDSVDNHFGAGAPKIGMSILSFWDINNSAAPTGMEYVGFAPDDSATPPYLSITYIIPLPNAPTEFRLMPIAGRSDSLAASWTVNHSAGVDSLKLGMIRAPGDTSWIVLGSKTATTARIGGLNPYSKYRVFARVDSAGKYGYSNIDAMYTRQELTTVAEAVDFYPLGSTSAGTYAAARAIATNDSVTYFENAVIGQSAFDTKRIRRLFLDVTMPSMQADIPPRFLKLFPKGLSDSSVTDFNIQAFSGYWTDVDVTMKYLKFDGWLSGFRGYNGANLLKSFSTSSYGARMTWELTNAGLDTALAKGGGKLRLAFLSSRDVPGTAATGNENIELDESADSLYYQYAPADGAPSNFQLTPIAPDTLQATWTDNSYSERGFVIVDAVSGVQVAGTDTTAANVTTLKISGLSVNTEYNWKVKAVGGGAHGLLSAGAAKYTLANVPGKITLTYPAGNRMKFVLNANGNPSYTEFAIQDSLSGKFIQSVAGVCTLGAAADWKTFTQWGGLNGDTLTVLVGKKYVLRPKARNEQ